MTFKSVATAIAGLSIAMAVAQTPAPQFRTVRGSAPAGFQKRERHPFLINALRALTRAHNQLQKGAHDFGGHRAAAEQLAAEAIAQVKLAIRYDRK